MWSQVAVLLTVLITSRAQDVNVKFAPNNNLNAAQPPNLNAPVKANAVANPAVAQQGYNFQDGAAALRDSAANVAGQMRQNMPSAQNVQNAVNQMPSQVKKFASDMQQSAFQLARGRPKPSLLNSECAADIKAICTEEKQRNNFDIMMCLQDKRVSGNCFSILYLLSFVLLLPAFLFTCVEIYDAAL